MPALFHKHQKGQQELFPREFWVLFFTHNMCDLCYNITFFWIKIIVGSPPFPVPLMVRF